MAFFYPVLTGALVANGKSGFRLNGIPGETTGGQPGNRRRAGAGRGAPGGILGMMGLPFGAGDPLAVTWLTDQADGFGY